MQCAMNGQDEQMIRSSDRPTMRMCYNVSSSLEGYMIYVLATAIPKDVQHYPSKPALFKTAKRIQARGSVNDRNDRVKICCQIQSTIWTIRIRRPRRLDRSRQPTPRIDDRRLQPGMRRIPSVWHGCTGCAQQHVRLFDRMSLTMR